MARRHRGQHPPPPLALPSRPAPRAQPWGSPKPPAAAAAPVIQVACPEAPRAGAAGTTGGGASPQPRPPTGRSARREGSGERGTPGRRALGLLIPLKVADQRRSFRGQGGAGGGGAGWGRSLLPALWARAPWPRTPNCQPRGKGLRPAGKLPKRPHRAFMELPLLWGLREGCLSLPTPENKTRMSGT